MILLRDAHSGFVSFDSGAAACSPLTLKMCFRPRIFRKHSVVRRIIVSHFSVQCTEDRALRGSYRASCSLASGKSTHRPLLSHSNVHLPFDQATSEKVAHAKISSQKRSKRKKIKKENRSEFATRIMCKRQVSPPLSSLSRRECRLQSGIVSMNRIKSIYGPDRARNVRCGRHLIVSMESFFLGLAKLCNRSCKRRNERT